MKRSALLAAAAACLMASQPAAPAQVGYAIPNGWAPSRGNRSHTKPSAAGKKAKSRPRAKAAAQSRRAQRR